jgi:hypothetical protein
MKLRNLSAALIAGAALCACANLDERGNEVVGGAVGGAGGAVVGRELGGRDGAVVGAGVGGAVGAAVGQRATRQQEQRGAEERVIYRDRRYGNGNNNDDDDDDRDRRRQRRHRDD